MSDFTDYTSKKKLRAAHVLTDEQFAIIDNIKGFFGVAIHNEKRYAAMTLYRANAVPQYSYLVIDFDTKAIEQAESIKLAKQAIRKRISPNFENEAETLVVPAVSIPRPSCDEVEKYLQKWRTTADLYEPEAVLKELFTKTRPYNQSIDDIILKAAALNTVYNTRITSIYPVAQRILSLDIDERLRSGDEKLVNELMGVDYMINGKASHTDHYSFASKYCSFHNSDAFPIYDSYVDAILWHYQGLDDSLIFKRNELKDYPKFKRIIKAFQQHFGLEQYTVKQLDQYLWQFGKDYF